MPLEDIGKIAYGAAFVVGGVGVGYLTKRYVPQKFRPIGIVASLGLGAYGLYSIYKGFKKEVGEPAQPGEEYPISILNPQPGDEWSTMVPHTVVVSVNNPYYVTKQVYIGMSMIHELGEVFDFRVLTAAIEPQEIIKCTWWMYGAPGQGPKGYYDVISSVWDVFPTGDCEIQGTCHRLGTATSNVTIKFFG